MPLGLGASGGGGGTATAGTGISVSGSTVTNTGVLSVTGGLGVYASTSSGAVTVAPSGWQLLGASTLSSSTTLVSFSGIAPHRHLAIVFSARSDALYAGTYDRLRMRINGDNGTNYQASGYSLETAMFLALIGGSSTLTNRYSVGTLFLHGASDSTKYKVIVVANTTRENAASPSNSMVITSNLPRMWKSVSTVTSITLQANNDWQTLSTGSRFELWGIR